MKALPQKLVLALLALIALNAPAITRYVDVNNPNALSPFLDWSTAATNIQDAVDAAVDGDEIVVTNGIYANGGRAVGTNIIVNRVAVDKPLTLRSVNGPAFTIIQGYQVPGTTNGDGAIRCVYLANGASLFGFTLTNGATRAVAETSSPYRESSGGGVWSEQQITVVSNCVLIGNSAVNGGGASRCTLTNCTLMHNSANNGGGGAFSSRLNNCTLTGNSALVYGGGAWSSTATNCTFTSNWADYGGGASGSTLINCILSGNSASHGGGVDGTLGFGDTFNSTLTNNSAIYGGGAWHGRLINCTLIGNSASRGGGASGGTTGGILTNCTLVGNVATNYGGGVDGGAYGCRVNNCTLVGNSAAIGGGAYFSTGNLQKTMNNCIVYFNTATDGPDYYHGILSYCCTATQPTNGVGNITNAPLFLDSAGGNFRLQANSPCINAGNNAYATMSTDLDGSPRIAGGTVDMGAYEFPLPTSTLSYAWAQQYGLPTDGTVDSADPDGDGANNWHESHADTIPTNALSVLLMVSATKSPTGAQVTWQGVSTRSYWLERATNLGVASPFQLISNNIAGASGTKTVTDPSATNGGSYFYRVGVQ